MKNYRKELWFDVTGRRAFVNITSQVEKCLRESGITEGLLLCNAMHITAGTITGCTSTFAFNARNHGSAIAGICDASCISRNRSSDL